MLYSAQISSSLSACVSGNVGKGSNWSDSESEEEPGLVFPRGPEKSIQRRLTLCWSSLTLQRLTAWVALWWSQVTQSGLGGKVRNQSCSNLSYSSHLSLLWCLIELLMHLFLQRCLGAEFFCNPDFAERELNCSLTWGRSGSKAWGRKGSRTAFLNP